MRKRVAITGAGVISSLASSATELHAALCEQRSGFRSIEEYVQQGFELRRGGNVESFEAERYLQGRSLRPLDRTGRLVAAAAALALENSGLDQEALANQEVGLVLGTMFSSMHTIGQFDRQALVEGPSYASPLDFANTVINSAAGQTAIWHKLRGINSTISSGGTSGLMALGYAVDLISYGTQNAILVGGADEFCFESFCGLERAGLLKHRDAEEDCSVPFDARRNGFALSEASALLMLEEWESALARGANILAEVRGHANAYDARYQTQSNGADAVVRAMRGALAEGELFAPEVDFISASANGSSLADKNEAFAIKAVFNGQAPRIPIVAIKSMIGETLGASGVVQTIDAIETLRTGALPGIAGLDNVDSELPALDFCRETRGLRVRSSLINSVGFDGQACSLLICAPRLEERGSAMA